MEPGMHWKLLEIIYAPAFSVSEPIMYKLSLNKISVTVNGPREMDVRHQTGGFNSGEIHVRVAF